MTADGAAPPLPATCSGSFWSRPLPAAAGGRIFGLAVSAGVIVPTSTLCAYLT